MHIQERDGKIISYVKDLLNFNKVKKVSDGYKTSMIKILDNKTIGEWACGKITRNTISIWRRKRKLAMKHFNSEKLKQHSLNTYAKLKETKIPTWNTYRNIEWEASVLMTRWNKEKASFVVSSNGWKNTSKDSEKLRKNPIAINTISNLDDCFSTCLDTIEKLSKNKIKAPSDSYMVIYKNNEIKIIIWDFDSVRTTDKNDIFFDDKMMSEDYKTIFEQNLKDFCVFIGIVSVYFNKGLLIEDFINFLLKEQAKKDSRVRHIEIEKILSRYIH